VNFLEVIPIAIFLPNLETLIGFYEEVNQTFNSSVARGYDGKESFIIRQFIN
jgi:hypothetical protein